MHETTYFQKYIHHNFHFFNYCHCHTVVKISKIVGEVIQVAKISSKKSDSILYQLHSLSFKTEKKYLKQ